MKMRKIVVTFFVTLALICVASNSFAERLSDFFKGFAYLENTYGKYDSWPQSAKVELVQLMVDNEILGSKTQLSWERESNQEVKEKMVDQILNQYFHNSIYVDTYNVIINELGQFEEWSQEYKALYTSLLIQYGQQKEDWPVYLIPNSDDLQQNEAIYISRKILSEKFELDNQLIATDVRAEFLINTVEYGTKPVWIIEFWNEDAFTDCYRIVIDNYGKVISYSAPNGQTQFENVKSNLVNLDKQAVPGDYDMSSEQIKSIATEKYIDLFKDDQMYGLNIDAYFIYDDKYNMGLEPVWIILFKEASDETIYEMLYSYDGKYMDGSDGKYEFQNTYNYYDVTDERFDYGFKDYSVEERADFSKKWKKVVDEFSESHPYYKNYNTLWYQSTRNIYGIPTPDVIKQNEAKSIAQNYIITLGAQKETIESRKITFAFDITDENNPLWKVMLFGIEGSHQSQTDRITYQIIINAKDGTVAQSYNNFKDDINAYNF